VVNTVVREATDKDAHGIAEVHVRAWQAAGILEAAAWALNDRPVVPAEAPVYERVEQRFIAPARQRLGSDAWETASAGARSLSADSAIALALEPGLLPG
jgi:hypothetical protein